MRSEFSFRAGFKFPAVAMLVTVLSVLAMTSVSIGPARAQTVLTQAQTAAFQAALNAALQNAGADASAAISQAVLEAIRTYGPDAAGSIASVTLTVAEAANVPGAQIGMGLAMAAASLEPDGHTAALAIAQVLANEGKAAEIATFRETVTRLGFVALASAADEENGIVTGAVPGGPGNGGSFSGTFNGSGPGAGGGGGCLNPSCTKVF